MFTYPNLKQYAHFLLENQLDQLVTLNLQRAKEVELPLLTLFKNFSKQELFEFSKQSILTLLQDLVGQKALQSHQESIHRWRLDQLQGVPKGAIEAKDMSFTPHVRKYAFIKLLPTYTNDQALSESIILELETFYTHSLELSLRAYVEIQQEKLQQEKDFLQTLLDHTAEGISAYDSNGKITLWNKALEERTGLSREKVVGKKNNEIFPDYQSSAESKALDQVLQGVKIQLKDMPFRHSEGFYEADLIPITSPAEGVTGALVVSKNITEQKKWATKLALQNQELAQALEELRASEDQLITLNDQLEKRVEQRTKQLEIAHQATEHERRRLNTFFMQAPAAICILDGPSLIFQLVNTSYQQLFIGRELLGKSVYEALPEIIGQPIEKILQQVYQSGKPFIGEELPFGIVRKEGEPQQEGFFNFIYQPRINEQNQVDGIMVFAYEVTQLVQARQIIEQSAQRFELLLESIPAMAWTNLPTGEVSFFNRRWYDFTGMNVEQSREWGWQSAIHPEDLQQTMNNYLHALSTGANFEMEVRFQRRADGLYRWHLNRATPVYDEKRQIILWVGTCTDIDDQKTAQQQLQGLTHELVAINEELLSANEKLSVNEDQLRQTLDHTVELNTKLEQQGEFLSSIISQSPFSTWIASKEGTLIRLNKACMELFGLEDEGQAIGKYNILKDNTLSSEPFFKDKEGKVINAVVQHEDITERKKAQAAVAYQNKLIKTITDNASSALFMMDAGGYCTFINPAGEKMFGYSYEQISQQPLHYMIHHHRPDGTFYPIQDCPLDRALPQNYDIRAHEDLFFAKDGSALAVSCAASPIFENGTPIATVIEVRDIRSEKQAQQQILQANSALARKNEELQKINTDLDNFIYTASHDLKSPIANLDGLLQTLSRRIKNTIPEREQEMLQLMNSSIIKFKDTLQALLEVTKAQKNLEDGKENVDIKDLLEEIKEDIKEMVEESGALFQIDLQEPDISFARANLRSILYNLISNAVKYRSKDRTLEIRIYTIKEKGYTVLGVKDNGLGIAQNQLPKLFSMFKRFHAHIEGTGIGLYVIKRVVENYGGKIEVESYEGAGTHFKVFFPEKVMEGQQ